MRLRIVTRRDLSEGRRAAQVAHAMAEWCASYGPHAGTVDVLAVDSELSLRAAMPTGARVAGWREPDLKGQLTAFATDAVVPAERL